ncbi:hypothetical protein [Portibacter marinus]|uniref:hypothetical protein n=1 Tax=Portibacter marinus TaxID=2898660 RepID=UPI001F269F4A|nr:hypothetical protein [Portibacter marinus]
MSCKNEEDPKSYLIKEKNQVWSVKEVDGEFSKDQLTYLETYEYDSDGNEIGHLIYNTDGELNGKELSVFDDNHTRPIGTRYYTPQDSLLSYYHLTYNEKGEKITRKGFDAATDELLRIERFSYDDKGNMIRKEIRTHEDQLLASYVFKYDEFGNKTDMASYNGEGIERVREIYKITKRDNENQWLENWGWQGERPVTFRTRELIYSTN